MYCAVHGKDFETCRCRMVDHIKNTMTDRVVNHNTISRLEETKGKSLNKLNCLLHPLDTIASMCRSAMKASGT